MSKMNFLPVILGTDTNAYGMARSFHEEYGIKSKVIGSRLLCMCQDSTIVEPVIINGFLEEEIFLQEIIKCAIKFKDISDNLLLIACSDSYAELIIKNKEELSKYYKFSYTSEDMMNKLQNKASFYQICEEYGLDYPSTIIIDPDTDRNLNIDYTYPLVLKPANSIEFFNTHFEGKKKAYIIDSYDELIETINVIYSTEYQSKLIIQEFIPGDDTAMRVLNAYCNQHSKVKMMCLGHPVLEDYSPELIGNYVAIISEYNDEIYKQFQKFLEKIGHVGFANFDIKYDRRDGKFKVFEINLRQGRSSFFATASGYNLAKYLVDDLVYGNDLSTDYGNEEHLWLSVPKKVALKYIENAEIKVKIKELIKKNKFSYSLYYNKDKNLIRNLRCYRYYAKHKESYAKYFIKKK